MTSGEERSDELLCALVSQGDRAAEEELAGRYGRLVRICARPHFLAGGDSEDLIQEGMIGLLSAIRTFREDRDTRFATYAETCIRNRILAAQRSSVRDKHTPLNSALPLPEPSGPDPYFNALLQPQSPEDALIDREEREGQRAALYSRLSQFEKTVLKAYLSGLSYREIALQTGKSSKSVDNAVQRIRRKIGRSLHSGDISVS